MNIKLTINGKEIDAQISEADAQKIQPSESRFDRNGIGDQYFEVDSRGNTFAICEQNMPVDDFRFSIGNYFTSKKQAQDHIRALKLWQAIKVFRQEREGDEWKKLDFSKSNKKYNISYSNDDGKPFISFSSRVKYGVVCFAKEGVAQAAINEFYGELMWYFTEFEDD